MRTTNRQVIKEVPWGVYVWELPDGGFVQDDGGNFMLIFSEEGDREKIKKLADAARHFGFGEGRPVFWSGKRPISDEEYEHQLARQRAGLVPDPLDTGAIADEQRIRRSRNE